MQIFELINPLDLILLHRGGSVPKKYFRTFLFREIWGDSWNFGDDLKYSAIEVNKDFREPALLALGIPTIPEPKVFLPGFNTQEDIDYTVELNPWQWIDVWLEHCIYCDKNNIPPPVDEETCDLPDEIDDEPFNFLFIRNVPVYDVEYEDVSLQYFLCNSKECKHCQYLIDNIMAKEGKDHVCLRIIMNKENPNEVEKVIIVPYEQAHGSFEKKEEKLVLNKKKKLNEDDHVFEDEYELPYCSVENGCLIRKLLPDYLKDSRTEKLFCDQCPKTEENIKNKILDNYDFFPNETDDKDNDSEVKNDGINKNSETSESDTSDTICEELDAVGQYLQAGKDSPHQYLLDKSDKQSSLDSSGVLFEDVLQTDESSYNKRKNEKNMKENIINANISFGTIKFGDIHSSDHKSNDEEGSIMPIEDIFNEKDKSSTQKIGFMDDFSSSNECGYNMHERNIFEVKDSNFDQFSSCSSSVTFKTANETIKDDKPVKGQEEVTNNNKNCEVGFLNNDRFSGNEQETLKTKNTQLTTEYEGNSEYKEVVLDIKHTLDDPEDDCRDFNEKTKKIITEELEKLECGMRTKVIKQPFDELSSYESSHGFIEKSDDEEELDKLNLVHHVAIWSIANDVKPMRRLISPFEITSLSFCPHNGRFLAGGTSTGQIVLWDLENPLEHKEHQIKERSDFDILGFKHLERTMCWYKRLRPDQRIYITAISNKANSHMERVVNVTWLPPNLKISPKSGKYEEISSEDEFSLQFMSASTDGVLKFWDLKSFPLPVNEPPNNKNGFYRPGHYKLPSNLQKVESPYSNLFLRWNPMFQVRFEIRDNVGVKKYHVTYISHDQLLYTYEKLASEENKDTRNIELMEIYKFGSVCTTDFMNYEALIGTVDGCILLFSWKPHSGTQEMALDEKLIEQEGIVARMIRQFKPIHDGPITCIKRHPTNNNIFLTTGGHVFALWKINQEGPLKWKRYTNCFATAIDWSKFRPSSFTIGRSDGCMEMWDLYELENKPNIVLKVTTGAIYDFTAPYLPIPHPLFGITDQKGILKFYYIPWELQESRPGEAQTFFEKIEVEHERKIAMEKKKSDYANKDQNTKPAAKHKIIMSDTDIKLKESEDVLKKKEIIGCRKFKEELYKWYLRRRGRNAAWLDESEKKWFKKEEEYMIKTILQNKKINMKELEHAVTPLYKKEKHEMEVAVKILEVLEMADEIFRNAVQELALVRDYGNKSQVSLEIESMNFGDLHDVMEKVDLYFGESYENTENELETYVETHKIEKEWTFAELCEKNQHIRDFWNDRRRLLNPEYKWCRELMQEELDKAGYKFSYYTNHEESYLQKKYKRRVENIEELKKRFGDDYDPYWDLHDRYASRNQKSDEQASDIKINSQFHKDIYHLQAKKNSSKHSQREVNVVLPEGSFYRKYMPPEKNIKWEKPIPYEERVYTHSKMFQDQLGDSERSVSSESTKISSDSGLEFEPDYTGEDVGLNTSSFRKTQPPPEPSTVSLEKTESSSSDGVDRSHEQEEKTVQDEPKDKSKGAVRFEEHQTSVHKETRIPKNVEDVTIKTKKVIDFEKEDITGRYHNLDDLRKLVKEKKMRGEEIIDIDDLSVSYESIPGSISSSSPSPDMSLKTEELFSDDWSIGDDSEEECFKDHFKELFEDSTPRYEQPKVIPYDRDLFVDEPTEEWMEEDLKPVVKLQEQEKDEKELENEEQPKKPDIKTTAIFEKEKAVKDKIEKLESMDESPDVINTVPPLDQSESKVERIKHVLEKRCAQND